MKSTASRPTSRVATLAALAILITAIARVLQAQGCPDAELRIVIDSREQIDGRVFCEGFVTARGDVTVDRLVSGCECVTLARVGRLPASVSLGRPIPIRFVVDPRGVREQVSPSILAFLSSGAVLVLPIETIT